jgi:hypothetical protein
VDRRQHPVPAANVPRSPRSTIVRNDLARQVAAWLRENAGAKRVGVIGDLLHPEPLDYWSELSLVVWGVDLGDFPLLRGLRDLDTQQVVHLVDPERPDREEKEAIQRELVDLE